MWPAASTVTVARTSVTAAAEPWTIRRRAGYRPAALPGPPGRAARAAREFTVYQITPAAMVTTMTATAAHANAWNRLITKAVQQPRPMIPSAGCRNSSRGCWPGWVVIRVWLIGGTFAPAATAAEAAAGTPAGLRTAAGARASAGAGSPEARASRRAARTDTPAAAVQIQSSKAAMSKSSPFASTLPALGIALPAMSFAQASPRDAEMMALALAQAQASLADGGVPVGAVLAGDGQLIAAGHNERVQRGDPVAHGEISALRNAGRRATYAGTTMYTTLSPCPMCTGAILLFQIPRVVVGEATTFPGDLPFLASRGVEVVLLDDDRCMAAMREFQQRYPEVWSEDIGGR